MPVAPQIIASQRGEDSIGTVRGGGRIPGVLYGHGIDNQTITVDERAFAKLFSYAGYTSLVDLKIGDVGHNVLIREVQIHPVRGFVLHADFYQVRMDEKVTADVSLVFVGESKAIKDFGGVLVRTADSVPVEALPADLPREIQVDISALVDFDATIRIADLVVGAGVVILRDAEDSIASVQPPRSDAEIEQLSEEVKEDVASVEGVEKKSEADEDTAVTDTKDAKEAPEGKKE